jgi:hypothetical protein
MGNEFLQKDSPAYSPGNDRFPFEIVGEDFHRRGIAGQQTSRHIYIFSCISAFKCILIKYDYLQLNQQSAILDKLYEIKKDQCVHDSTEVYNDNVAFNRH